MKKNNSFDFPPHTKTRLIRLRAVDGYASDITRYSIDPSYNPHSYSPLVLQPTFDLWRILPKI